MDPGEHISALCLVTPESRSTIRLLRADMVKPDRFRDWLKGVKAVAIEKAEGGARPFAVKHLLPAQWVGGEMSGLAKAYGLPVVTASASEVRKAIIGKMPRTPSGLDLPRANADQWIARALPSIVVGMVKTNEHHRDAILLAAYAARKLWGQQR